MFGLVSNLKNSQNEPPGNGTKVFGLKGVRLKAKDSRGSRKFANTEVIGDIDYQPKAIRTVAPWGY